MPFPWAYSLAAWVEPVAIVVAVLAAAWMAFLVARLRLRKTVSTALVLVLAVGVAIGAHAFLRTRITRLSLNSIRQVGLELRRDGLRTNALRYDTKVTLDVSLNAPGALGTITRYLVHKDTTVTSQVAVYGLINFATIDAKVATVNRQARTITLSLPDPEIGRNTAYIASVNGVRQKDGPLTAAAQGVAGIVSSIFHGTTVAVNPAPELAKAEARAVRAARRSTALATCGKEEIVGQLTRIFRLTPAYRDYTVHVRWPVPPDPSVNCAALQSDFLHSR